MRKSRLIPVDLPTKSFIKAFIQTQFGEKPVMVSSHHIGNKLFDLLQRHENNNRTHYTMRAFPVKLRVYIPWEAYNTKGGFLNETNIISFNSYVQRYMNDYINMWLDVYLEVTGSVEIAIELMREKTGLSEEMVSYDKVKKSFYRYRIAKGLLMPRGGLKRMSNQKIQMIL